MKFSIWKRADAASSLKGRGLKSVPRTEILVKLVLPFWSVVRLSLEFEECQVVETAHLPDLKRDRYFGLRRVQQMSVSRSMLMTDERISLTDERQRRFELRPLRVFAASMVREDLVQHEAAESLSNLIECMV